MTIIPTDIPNFWPILMSAIGTIIWLIRLEGRVNQGDRDHISTEKLIVSVDKRIDVVVGKHDALESKVLQQLSEVRESLARIEGSLNK